MELSNQSKNIKLFFLRHLVEDELLHSQAVQNTLCPHNIDVVVATNAQEAITLSKSNSFDLILMDINLPDGNGVECSQQCLLTQEHTPLLISFSNYTKSELESMFDELPFQDYLDKPFTLEQLLNHLAPLAPKCDRE